MAFVCINALPTKKTQWVRPATTTSRPVATQPRMVAVEPTKTGTVLSQHAQDLMSYVRGHKSIFRAGEDFDSTQVTLFRKNDTGRSFTPLDELATNAHVLPGGSVAAMLLVQKDEFTKIALSAIEKQSPHIMDDDTLYGILEYDLIVLLRTISYGAACQVTDFIHDNNMGVMKMLHDEAGIPKDSIPTAIIAVKEAVLSQIAEADLIDSTGQCFDVVHDFFSE